MNKKEPHSRLFNNTQDIGGSASSPDLPTSYRNSPPDSPSLTRHQSMELTSRRFEGPKPPNYTYNNDNNNNINNNNINNNNSNYNLSLNTTVNSPKQIGIPVNIGGLYYLLNRVGLEILEVSHPENKLSKILEDKDDDLTIFRLDCTATLDDPKIFDNHCKCLRFMPQTNDPHYCALCSHHTNLHSKFLDRNGLLFAYIIRYMDNLSRIFYHRTNFLFDSKDLGFGHSNLHSDSLSQNSAHSEAKLYQEMLQSAPPYERVQLENELNFYGIQHPEDLYTSEGLYYIKNRDDIKKVGAHQNSIYQAVTFRNAIYSKFDVKPHKKSKEHFQKLRKATSENVVLPLAYYNSEKNPFILTEPVTCLDADQKQFFTFIELLSTMRQSAEGLYSFHSKAKIAHKEFNNESIFRVGQVIKVAFTSWRSNGDESLLKDPFVDKAENGRGHKNGDIYSWAVTFCYFLWKQKFNELVSEYGGAIKSPLINFLKSDPPFYGPKRVCLESQYYKEQNHTLCELLIKCLSHETSSFSAVTKRLDDLILQYSLKQPETQLFWKKKFVGARFVRALELITTILWHFPPPSNIHESGSTITTTATITKSAKKFLWALIGDPTKAADTKHNHLVSVEYFGSVFENCFGPLDLGIYERIKQCWNNPGFLGCLDDDTADQKVNQAGYAFRISPRKTWGLDGKFVLCVRPRTPDVNLQSSDNSSNWFSFEFFWNPKTQMFNRGKFQFKSLNELSEMFEGSQQKEAMRKFDFENKVKDIPKNEKRRWIELHDSLYRGPETSVNGLIEFEK